MSSSNLFVKNCITRVNLGKCVNKLRAFRKKAKSPFDGDQSQIESLLMRLKGGKVQIGVRQASGVGCA